MKIVVAGSYRKYWNEVSGLIKLLELNGHEVIAPKSEWEPSITENGFVKFKGEEDKSIKDLENGFLDKIVEADAVVVYNPRGYVGDTAGMETGFIYGIMCKADNNKKLYFTEPLIGSYFFEGYGKYFFTDNDESHLDKIGDLILNDARYNFIKYVYFNVWRVDVLSLVDKQNRKVLNEFIVETLRYYIFNHDAIFGIEALLNQKNKMDL